MVSPYVVLWIRIRMFLDLQDPDPSFFVQIWVRILQSTGKKSKKNKKTLNFNFSWLLFDFISLKTDVNVSDSDPMSPDPDPMSTDPDPDPAKYQSGSGTRVLMSKYWKKFTAEKNDVSLIKNYYLLTLGFHKEHPSYRRSIQPSKENIQHFKTRNFSTFSYFCG